MEAADLKNFNRAKVPSEKSFGLTISFALIVYSVLFRRELNFMFLAASFVLVIISYRFSKILHLPNLYWMKLGEKIGTIMTPVVMGAIFFIVITPFGLLLRTLGKLQFQYRNDNEQESYWIQRPEIDFREDNFKQQF